MALPKILEKFNQCLPLSGGRMTGAIKWNGGYVVENTYPEGALFIANDTTHGYSYFGVYGPNNPTNKNAFVAKIGDGTNIKYFLLRPNGQMLWDGKEVARLDSISLSANYLKFHDGTLIGRAIGTAREGTCAITFPVPFSENPVVVPYVGARQSSITVTITDVSSTGCTIVARDSKTGEYWSSSVGVGCIAMGKWK